MPLVKARHRTDDQTREHRRMRLSFRISQPFKPEDETGNAKRE